MTTARHPEPAEPALQTEPATPDFRRRLLDGLASSIADDGYRATTVADIVRRARTSRRTFYQHFPDKESCYVALLAEANAAMIRHISASVDPAAPWRTQVRQAIEAWIRSAESSPTLMVSWIRDLPSLGNAARRLQREAMAGFVVMVQTLADNDQWRDAGLGPISRQHAILLLGGLRELTATTLEDGGRMSDLAEVAVAGSIALFGPRPEG
ncbi:AcrR family transcriptional regulator [Pseudonocardia eucalypti]|nr:AcrR family transcriptional regulator [Pseudonocardia eucalypti]